MPRPNPPGGPPGRPPPGGPPGGPPGRPPPGGPPKPPPNPPLGLRWLSVMAVVTNTLSPETIGQDQAAPGTSTFQATFLSGPHSAGIGSADSPLPPGPRNCGQSPPPAAAGTRAPRASAKILPMCMFAPPVQDQVPRDRDHRSEMRKV